MSLLKDENQNQSRVIIQNQSFDNLDQFSAVLNQKRHYRFTQLTKAPFEYQINLLDFGLAQFVKVKSSCTLQARGDKSEGFIEFACLFNDNITIPYYSHGLPLESQHLFGFDYNRDVDSILPANMELVLFRIEKKSFQDCLEALDRPDIDYRLLANNYLLLPETITTVKCYLNRIFRSVEKSPHILKQPLLEKLILEDFVPLLINSIPYSLDETSLQLSPSFLAKLFQEARDFMIAHLDQPITLKDLCLALHAGSRTINYGFKEVLGLSPIAYLKILRLNQVRKILIIANPKETTVEEVANSCGFWSLGHFCRDYRQFFGESPSITLNSYYA